MPVNVPVTVWSPPDPNADLLYTGSTDITDTTGANITDTTHAVITDTGVTQTLAPATIYGENDAE